MICRLTAHTAIKFYDEFSPSLRTRHNQIIHHLSTLLLPSHVQHDELAQRFRNEKYQIRMSRSGFSLLVGWLTEGVGGEATGEGEGFSGERGKRGRASVMRVVNNHLKFDGNYRTLLHSIAHKYLLGIQSRHQVRHLYRQMHGRNQLVSLRR